MSKEKNEGNRKKKEKGRKKTENEKEKRNGKEKKQKKNKKNTKRKKKNPTTLNISFQITFRLPIKAPHPQYSKYEIAPSAQVKLYLTL